MIAKNQYEDKMWLSFWSLDYVLEISQFSNPKVHILYALLSSNKTFQHKNNAISNRSGWIEELSNQFDYPRLVIFTDGKKMNSGTKIRIYSEEVGEFATV